ncbi:hypothetical protein AVEN_252008-1 [Araneus ventricosus]|uniref:Uncharacterized protein n=1 Tax=Araneus ventricosus TaxID=182803 RepID=A0A4Y2QJD8_ARAVE|nr:hypothetical protein AVEN_252008-1 [Araneus ventricosus]
MNRMFTALIQENRSFKEGERSFVFNFLCSNKCDDSTVHKLFKALLCRIDRSYDIATFGARVTGQSQVLQLTQMAWWPRHSTFQSIHLSRSVTIAPRIVNPPTTNHSDSRPPSSPISSLNHAPQVSSHTHARSTYSRWLICDPHSIWSDRYPVWLDTQPFVSHHSTNYFSNRRPVLVGIGRICVE